MKKRTRAFSLLLAATMTAMVALTGCGGGGDTDSTADGGNKNNDKEVKLTFYTQNTPVSEFDRIMEKANAIIKEEINAELDLVLVDNSAYAEKMNLMINAGDKFDLCFSGNWGDMNYFQNAAKGAYKDLTDLIPEYAPESYARVPESLWDGVKVKGEIYGIINYQQWGMSIAKGVGIRRDLAEEFDYDWQSIKKLSDLEPYLADVKKNYPDMVPFEYVSDGDIFVQNPLLFLMDAVGDSTDPGWIGINDGDNPKVINQFATDEYKEHLTMMRKWYQEGYVRKDAATLKDMMPDREANRVAAQVIQGYPDSIEEPDQIPTQKMSHTKPGKAPQVTVSMTEPFVPSGGPATAVTAVGANSENPERALQLIELLNTNDELFCLITLGEEDVDWHYLPEDDKENDVAKGAWMPIDGKYNYNWMEWALGQSFSPTFTRASYDDNENGELAKKLQEVVFEGDKTALTSPIMGFTFDPSNVKTELANCSAIIGEMVPALGSGSVDPDEKLPEFLQRLESAGVDKVIEEKQAQIDEWLKTK